MVEGPDGDDSRAEAVASALARELQGLCDKVRPWPPARWQAAADGREGTRADACFALVLELVALGRQAGVPVPEGAVVPRLHDLALSHQVAVVGNDLLDACAGPAEVQPLGVLRSALRAVLETRAALDGQPPPEALLALTR